MGLFVYEGVTLVGGHIKAWRVSKNPVWVDGEPPSARTEVWMSGDGEEVGWVFDGDLSAQLTAAVTQ